MSEAHHEDHDSLQHAPAPTPIERRAAALEALLTEKGLVPDGFIEEVNRIYENDVGPMNGARAVARAWVDPDFKARLLEDGTTALAELGIDTNGRIVAVANEPGSHNVVVCTLCSCYPWSVLGLPPAWYKEAPYRARMVREPRVVLAQMGCQVPDDTDIRVWDSSAEVRYLVVPERPLGTDGLSEEELAQLVTRDSMIGVTRL
jgi:nitrile hydratase subunit alpha